MDGRRLREGVRIVVWGEKSTDEDVEPRGGELRLERARAVRDALVSLGVEPVLVETRVRDGGARAVIEAEGCR